MPSSTQVGQPAKHERIELPLVKLPENGPRNTQAQNAPNTGAAPIQKTEPKEHVQKKDSSV